MRSRNLVALMAIAGVLLVLWFVTRKPPEERGRQDTAQKETLFPEVREDQVNRIAIATLGTSVVLRRIEDKWYVDREGQRRADIEALERLFQTLADVPPGKLVSRDPDKFLNFQVDDLTGKRLQMFDLDGEQLFDVVVGKRPKMDFTSVYVRQADSDDTYKVNAALAFVLDRTGDWRNKIMIRAAADAIAKITVETTTQTIVMSRERLTSGAESVQTDWAPWRMERPYVDELRIKMGSDMTGRLRHLSAKGLEDNRAGKPLSDFGLEPAHTTVTIEEEGRGATVLNFGARLAERAPSDRYAMVEGDPQIYVLDKAVCDLFLRKAINFIPARSGRPVMADDLTPEPETQPQDEATSPAPALDLGDASPTTSSSE